MEQNWSICYNFNVVMRVFWPILVSLVRKELKKANFDIDGELEVLKIVDDYGVLRLESEDDCYIVKYYFNGNVSSKVSFIKQLENNGIEVGLVLYTNKIIVYKDYIRSGFFRMVEERDLKNKDFICKLAKWYKKFHSINIEGLECFKDCFNVDNIRKIIKNYNLNNNCFFQYVCRNFDNISLKIKRSKSCVIYGKVSLKNIVISKDNSKIIFVDFDGIYEGFIFDDVKNVFLLIPEDFRQTFIDEYGEIDDQQAVVSEIVKCVSILSADSDKNNHSDIGDCLDMVNSESFFNNIKTLVEWY